MSTAAAVIVAVPPQERLSQETHRRVAVPSWMHGAAGIAGGATSMAIFYPLDLIRTRLHTVTGKAGESRLRSARRILEEEGLRGMYRGVKLAVLVHGVGWGMYLSVFRGLQQNLVAYHGYESGLTDFVSACGAASATAFVATPLNFLKTRVQLHEPGKVADTSPERRGARALLRSVVKNEGYFVLFRGFGPQLLLSSHTTIQVGIYEQVKRRVWGSSHSEMPLSGVALTSGFARGVASCVCNPLEVVRTRLQDKRNLGTLQYASMGAAFRTIYCNEGVRGFYRGLWVNMMRVVPSTMCAFVIYEQVLEAHRVVTNHIRSNAEAKLLQQLPGGPQP